MIPFVWLLTLLGILISVAFLVLFERKVLGYMQLRKGPNKLGMWGIFQSFADAVKLFSKSLMKILFMEDIYYLASPVISIFLSLFMWVVSPILWNLVDLKFSMIIIFCCLGVSVFPLMIMGWYSSSKYSILGSLRSVSQSVSYEVGLLMIFLCMVLLIKSFNMAEFMKFQKTTFLAFLAPVTLLAMLMSFFAELNRAPFDFSEGESELVSGFNIEYSSISFSLIFLAEYSSVILMSFILSLMFFQVNFLLAFVLLFTFLIIWARGSFPRFRYDYMMQLVWKVMLTAMLASFFFYMLM